MRTISELYRKLSDLIDELIDAKAKHVRETLGKEAHVQLDAIEQEYAKLEYVVEDERRLRNKRTRRDQDNPEA